MLEDLKEIRRFIDKFIAIICHAEHSLTDDTYAQFFGNFKLLKST